MKKIRMSKTTSQIVSIVLAVAAIIGVVALVGNIAKGSDDGYKKINPSYTVGAIDKATGKCLNDVENALYTKDIIECTGVELYADFDSDIEYTVHFYDEDGKWLSCQDNEDLNLKINEMPEGAVGIRVVIYPQSDENNKVSWLEKGTYARQLTVKITTVKKAATETTETAA